MLGSGAMTNSIEDVTRQADVIMLVGSNPEEAHPVIGMQLRARSNAVAGSSWSTRATSGWRRRPTSI